MNALLNPQVLYGMDTQSAAKFLVDEIKVLNVFLKDLLEDAYLIWLDLCCGDGNIHPLLLSRRCLGFYVQDCNVNFLTAVKQGALLGGYSHKIWGYILCDLAHLNLGQLGRKIDVAIGRQAAGYLGGDNFRELLRKLYEAGVHTLILRECICVDVKDIHTEEDQQYRVRTKAQYDDLLENVPGCVALLYAHRTEEYPSHYDGVFFLYMHIKLTGRAPSPKKEKK